MPSTRPPKNTDEASTKGVVRGVVTSICKLCKGEYEQPHCRAKRDKFCSRECGDKFRKDKAKRLVVGCPCCGKEFRARPAQLEGGRRPYCSISCGSKSQERTKERYDKCKETWTKNKDTHNYPSGAESVSWKGGRAISNGYVMIFIGIIDGKRKSVAEHRLVMESHLGRALSNDEIVHHINEVKDDNRIENLQIMTRAEHLNHHRHSYKKGLLNVI